MGKKGSRAIRKESIEHYCPLNKVQRQWSDRKKIVLEPLFKSYAFVRVLEDNLALVKQTDGILNVVHWLKKPAVIKDNEIDAIKQFLDKHENVELEKIEVNVNDIVKIIHGPLVSREGNVIEVLNQSVKVLLPSLGYSLIANVYKTNIEKVKVLEKKSLFKNN